MLLIRIVSTPADDNQPHVQEGRRPKFSSPQSIVLWLKRGKEETFELLDHYVQSGHSLKWGQTFTVDDKEEKGINKEKKYLIT